MSSVDRRSWMATDVSLIRWRKRQEAPFRLQGPSTLRRRLIWKRSFHTKDAASNVFRPYLPPSQRLFWNTTIIGHVWFAFDENFGPARKSHDYRDVIVFLACEYSRLSFAPSTTCEKRRALRFVSHVEAGANERRLYSQAIVFLEKLRVFKIPSIYTETQSRRFWISPLLKNVFEKLPSRDGLVWTVGLTVEIIRRG